MDNVKLIVNLKLKPLESQFAALRETLERANDAANWISEQAFNQKVFKQFYLHKISYHEAKAKFDLTAQVVIRTIAKVADSYQIQTAKQTTFRKHGSIAYDARIIRFKANNSVNIWTVVGRQTIPFECGTHQRKLLPFLKGEVDLILRKGNFYLNAVVDIEEPEKLGFSDIIGVDFGVVNIVTDSKGESVSGASVEQFRQRYSALRGILQRKASAQSKAGKRPRKIRRFLKQVSRHERQFRRHTNHVISKQLVEKAKAQDSALALENLKGIRKRIERRFRVS